MHSLVGRHGEEEDYWLKIQSIKNNDEKDYCFLDYNGYDCRC